MSSAEPGAANEFDGQSTLFGHPTGLYTLFFAEMWERFSYYGMRALLVLYMIKGFMKLGDESAYAIYGAYTALVYATPFIGGILADRVLGARRAVVIGGLLMATGHLLMTVENTTFFFTALSFLIIGNGFFKPNISTIVGGLYAKDSPKKDAGFTIFYMGINLGAAMSPIICGYVGEVYGWHIGFGLATIGMLIGLAVFVAPTRLTQTLILGGAIITAGSMLFLQDSFLQLAVRIFLAAALVTSGVVAFVALGRGGLPDHAGRPRDPEAAKRKVLGLLRNDVAIYLGILLAVPAIALLVSQNKIAGIVLTVTGAIALGYLIFEAIVRCTKIERERLFVILILMFFLLLFWAFFEQAGSSINNFTDRNVDRVLEARVIGPDEVGSSVTFSPEPTATSETTPPLTQEQLGYRRNGEMFALTELSKIRDGSDADVIRTAEQPWEISEEHVGMKVGGAEIPASEFQAANPIFILLFGLVFSALWGFLGAKGLDPSPPFKFGLGLLQLGLGFGVLWYGAMNPDARGMVWVGWLLLGYMLHTTGELCLSPVGLSMVTKLSPSRIVSTVMGAWFLATAFSNYLAGLIATATGVSHGESGGEQTIPPPIETVGIYGDVFGKIAIAGIISAVICLVISPLLTKWMHLEVDDEHIADLPIQIPAGDDPTATS
ncbi:MAG: MFS transporter [Pirellulaceae bacterium]|nr:MFS transporter [Pirellulaceae bacterium]